MDQVPIAPDTRESKANRAPAATQVVTLRPRARAQPDLANTSSEVLGEYVPGSYPPRTTESAIENLQERALSGEAEAAMELARMQEFCGPILEVLRTGQSYADSIYGEKPADVRARLEFEESRCRPLLVLDSEVTPKRLNEIAAENGAGAAKTWKVLNDSSIPLADKQELAIEGAASGEPAALYDMAQIIASGILGYPHPEDRVAWMMAACQLGYECGPSSISVQRGCNIQLNCPPGINFIDYVATYELPPALFRRAEYQSQEIVRAIEQEAVSDYVRERYAEPPP